MAARRDLRDLELDVVARVERRSLGSADDIAVDEDLEDLDVCRDFVDDGDVVEGDGNGSGRDRQEVRELLTDFRGVRSGLAHVVRGAGSDGGRAGGTDAVVALARGELVRRARVEGVVLVDAGEVDDRDGRSDVAVDDHVVLRDEFGAR